jgi:hypothetical protein
VKVGFFSEISFQLGTTIWFSNMCLKFLSNRVVINFQYFTYNFIIHLVPGISKFKVRLCKVLGWDYVISWSICRVEYKCHSRSKSIFKDHEAVKCLSSLHDKYVIVPANKASNNIVFVCKSYLLRMPMFKEVMNDMWLARISSLSNKVGLYVVLLEVLLFMPNSLIRHSK